MTTDNEILFDPNILFNRLIEKFEVKNDKELSAKLEFPARLIHKIRTRHVGVAGSFLLQISEKTKMNVSDLRILMGDRRKKVRPSYRVARELNPTSRRK